MYKSLCIPPKDSPAGEPFGCDTICQDIRVNAQVGTRSPYSLPFVILPVPARSPFRFIRHRRRSTPNLKEGAFWCGTNSNIKPALKGDSSRARPVGDAARGESGGIGSIASGSVARRPYSNQRCGFRVAKAGGVAARLLLFTSTPQSATPTASRKGEPYEERISLLAQAPFFDAEIHRRSCVGEKSQTFSLFRR